MAEVPQIQIASEDGEDMGGCAGKTDQQQQEEEKGLKTAIDKWYQDLLLKTVQTSPDHALKYAAVVSFPDATVLGVYPAGFVPNEKGVKDIIAGLQGDTAAIAEYGMKLGDDCLPSVPGKLDEGQGIYGTDGKEGGTDAFLSNKSLLIGCYASRPAASTRLLRKTAQYMKDQNK